MAEQLRKEPKDPWSKELYELSKYDWLTAVGLSQQHRLSPLDLRVAIALMTHADAETKLAWPSQRTLMAYVGAADERQVRTAISSLCASGAIVRSHIGKLDDPGRAKINRTPRGKAYELQMFWALEVFEASASRAGQREPLQLLSGKRHRTTLVRSGKRAEIEADRTTPVRSNRTTPVRSTADYGRPPNTESKLRETERAGKTDQAIASTRESGSSANAYERASRGE